MDRFQRVRGVAARERGKGRERGLALTPIFELGNMPELGFPVENLLAVLAAEGDVPLKRAHELNDLRNVVVVLGVPRPCRGVKEVVAREQLKEHCARPIKPRQREFVCSVVQESLRMFDALHEADQMSTSVSHLEPNMASGLLYCRVWMSLVKWRSVQLALPRSAILTVMRSSVLGSYGALGGRVLGSPAAGAGLKGSGGEVVPSPSPLPEGSTDIGREEDVAASTSSDDMGGAAEDEASGEGGCKAACWDKREGPWLG